MDKFIFFTILLEGCSAIAGFYYINKKSEEKSNQLLTFFLLLTFLTEAIGTIPLIIYHQESLHYLKGTVWYSNYWLFNPYNIISFVLYVVYFKLQLGNFLLKKILNVGIVFFVISSITNLILSDVFFNSYSSYTQFSGIILLFLSISFYYYELLISNRLLEIKNSVPFYVSISFLLFNLISMPLWIYMEYYSNRSPEFVIMYRYIYITANILLYSTYIFAFIYCAQQKQLPVLKNNKRAK